MTTTLAAGSAKAQQAPAPIVESRYPLQLPSSGYAPPADGYAAPPSYAGAGTALDVTYPPEMRWRSTGLVAGGAVLLGFSVVGLLAGSAMVGAHEPVQDINTPNCFECGGFDTTTRTPNVVLKPGFRTAGIVTLVGSAAALGAGITLLVIGAKKVPYEERAVKAASVTPSFSVGATGATFRLLF